LARIRCIIHDMDHLQLDYVKLSANFEHYIQDIHIDYPFYSKARVSEVEKLYGSRSLLKWLLLLNLCGKCFLLLLFFLIICLQKDPA